MATELLSVAATAATSPEFTLASGESATIALKGPDLSLPLDAILLEMKDDANDWQRVASLSGPQVLSGAGTFRVRRVANRGSVGAFRG